MEGLSDIFGELVESWHKEEVPDWTFTETNRNMADPESGKHPWKYQGEYWADTDNDSDDCGGVHTNSTVISHAAYLMWNGIDGNSAQKLSTDELAELWYRAMLMMPSDCDFTQCRRLVEYAAKSLEGLTDKQRECVSEAFDEVGIRDTDEELLTVDYHLLPDSTLNVYDRNNERYAGYTLQITGTIAMDEVSSAWQIDIGYRHDSTQVVNTAEPYKLDLYNGVYRFTISDLYSDDVYSFVVEVGDEGTDDDITLITSYEKPLIVTITDDDEPDDQDGKTSEVPDYSPVLEQYQDALNHHCYLKEDGTIDYDAAGEYVGVGILDAARYYKNYGDEWADENFYMYYALSDINDDGRDELFIGGGTEDSVEIYEAFTHDGEQPVPLFEVGGFGYRYHLTVLNDNTLAVNGSGGAELNSLTFYRLQENSLEPEIIEEYIQDGDEYSYRDGDGNEYSIGEDDYYTALNRFYADEKELSWMLIEADSFSGDSEIGNTGKEAISNEERYKAYADLIENYESQYGIAKVQKMDEWFSYMTGLCFMKLVDFTQSGQEDLLLVYQTNVDNAWGVSREYTFEVWGFQGNKMVMLDSGGLFGTDGGVKTVYLTEYNENIYLVTGGTDSFGYYYYHGYSNGEFGIVREAEWDWDEEYICSIDGIDVTYEEFETEQEKWLGNSIEYNLNYDCNAVLLLNEETKRALSPFYEGTDESTNDTEISVRDDTFEY